MKLLKGNGHKYLREKFIMSLSSFRVSHKMVSLGYVDLYLLKEQLLLFLKFNSSWSEGIDYIYDDSVLWKGIYELATEIWLKGSSDVVIFINVVELSNHAVFHLEFLKWIFWQGYYSFSQKLKHIVRLPFAITAYGMYILIYSYFISIGICLSCTYSTMQQQEGILFTMWQRGNVFKCQLFIFENLKTLELLLYWKVCFHVRNCGNATCHRLETPHQYSFNLYSPKVLSQVLLWMKFES